MNFFLTRPHVENAKGDVTTPDILIDRLFVFSGEASAPRPLVGLSHDIEAQTEQAGISVTPAILLFAAGAGTLVSPALSLIDGRLLLARKAWRMRYLENGFSALRLRMNDDEISLDEIGSYLGVVSSIPGGRLEHLPRGIGVVVKAEKLEARSVPSSREVVELIDTRSKGRLRHWVDMIDITRDSWEHRPAPDYATGPQNMGVKHYV